MVYRKLVKMPHRPVPCKKVFISKELSIFLQDYSKEHQYRKWIYRMRDTLLYNRLAGEKVSKKLIPEKYNNKYGVNHLFRYEHPGGYRSCYILVNRPQIGMCALILDLLSHKEYEDLFGY